MCVLVYTYIIMGKKMEGLPQVVKIGFKAGKAVVVGRG